MRLHVLLLPFVLGSLCLAQETTSVDKDALRQALPVPKLEWFVWNVPPNLFLEFNPVEIPARMAALRKRLTGTYRDAGILLELYDLQNLIGDADNNLLRRAAALAKARTARAPRDSEAWAHLGEAYLGLQRYSEAESALRRAIRLNPRSWKAWLTLSRVFQAQAATAVAGASAAVARHTEEEDTPPTPEEMQKAAQGLRRMMQLMTKAEECSDRAVALAPREIRVYHHRLGLRMVGNLISAALLARHNSDAPQFPDLLTPELRNDLSKMESLQPHNPAVHATRAFLPLIQYIPTSQAEHGVDWQQISPQGRADYQKAIANLERISRSADRRRATWALRNLASTRFFVRQFRELGIADLRRAIGLAPHEMENYEMLTTYLASSGRKDEAIAECGRWLKVKDNARARVILSKLLYERGQVDEAKEHARAALRIDPRDIDAHLLLAAYLLREGKHLAETQRLLDAVAPQMRESVPKDQRVHFLLQRGVLHALQGNLAAARWAVARARELQSGSEEVETIWKLLNPEQSS